MTFLGFVIVFIAAMAIAAELDDISSKLIAIRAEIEQWRKGKTS